jgi:hypothetical protein
MGGGQRGKQRNQSKNDGILQEIKDIDRGGDFATNVPRVKNFDRRPLNHSFALQHPSKTSMDDRLSALTTLIDSSNTKAPPAERTACRSFPRFIDDSALLARMHFFTSFCVIDASRHPIRSQSTTSFLADRLLRVFRPSSVLIHLRHSFSIVPRFPP